MTSHDRLKFPQRLYYTLSTIARRIKKIMKESCQYLFVVAVAGIFTVLGVVGQPLFVSPLSWSNFSLYNFEIVLSRLLVALPLLALFIVMAILLVRQIKIIDGKKDNDLVDKIASAFEKALEKDREIRLLEINKEISNHEFERYKRYIQTDEMARKLAEENQKSGLNKTNPNAT
jgi:hypothetical protein